MRRLDAEAFGVWSERDEAQCNRDDPFLSELTVVTASASMPVKTVRVTTKDGRVREVEVDGGFDLVEGCSYVFGLTRRAGAVMGLFRAPSPEEVRMLDHMAPSQWSAS